MISFDCFGIDDQSISLDQPQCDDGSLTLENVMPCADENPAEAVVTQEFVDRVSACMQYLNDKHKDNAIFCHQCGSHLDEDK